MLAIFTLVGHAQGTTGGRPYASQSSEQAAQGQSASSRSVQLEGELQILYHDFKDRNQLSYNLKLPNGKRVPLHFVKEPPTHFLTGDHVTADGQLSEDSLILYSGRTNLKKSGGGGSSSCTADSGQTCSTTSSIPLPHTFGPQSTLVILVNFQDDVVQPYTVADAQNFFDTTVNGFFNENSYGQTTIVATVRGWYTIPESITTCDSGQIATDAKAAAMADGVNLSNYTRYVYAFPNDTACGGWAGSSTLGGYPSETWINWSPLGAQLVNHELGHAMGLWHSHALDCGASDTVCSNGTIIEYGDLMDTMGVPQTPSPGYNAFQKERLGWLNYGASPSIQTITTSGTYTITPYENGFGPNALKVLQSADPTTGVKKWYYLEARQAIGFDAFLAAWPSDTTQNETAGVLFHLGTDGDGNSSLLLDMTPATPTSGFYYDMSLALGQSFTDSTAGVTFTTASVTSAGATVSVQFSNTSGPGSPTVGALTVATDQTNYSPGQTVSVTATASAGSSPVANVSVTFVVTNPNGGQTRGSATTGSNGQATYKLKLKSNAPTGTYVAGAAASALTASANFTVQ